MGFVLSLFVVNRSVTPRYAGAKSFRPEWWAGGEDRAAAVEGGYGFLSFLKGSRGSIEDVFAKVGLSARLQPPLADPSLSKVGRERWLLGGAPSETPGGIHIAAIQVPSMCGANTGGILEAEFCMAECLCALGRPY